MAKDWENASASAEAWILIAHMLARGGWFLRADPGSAFGADLQARIAGDVVILRRIYRDARDRHAR